MLKRITGGLLVIVMALSLIVMPTYAGSFSEENWVQFERGFYTSNQDFNIFENEVTDDGYLIDVKAVAKGTTTLSKTRNPIAYKIGDSSSHYGEYADMSASYAHMTFELAMFSDQWRNCMKYLTMRMDKDGTGSSRDAFVFDATTDGDGWVYPVKYNTSNSINFRDASGVWSLSPGPDGNGTANSHQTTLADSDYHKIDIICDLTGGPINYVFVDGRYMTAWKDTSLDKNHFHGIVFRTLEGKKVRGNSDYIAARMFPDRIGHREYYNTDDYTVTFEDVLNDAGLGDEVNDEKISFKTSNIRDFMPGAEQKFNVWSSSLEDNEIINQEVSYVENTATISHEVSVEGEYEVIASMIGGMYPPKDHGIAYRSYHPRAKFIKLSFDQTISNADAAIRYKLANSGANEAMKFWNNGGKLVTSLRGGDYNKTTKASMTGTNRIDWILEPVDGEDMYTHLYINNEYILSGAMGSASSVRVNNIYIESRGDVDLTIDNWSMTIYNDKATLDDIEAEIVTNNNYSVRWDETALFNGTGANDEYFSVGSIASTKEEIPDGAKLYTAIYGADGRMLDSDIVDFENGAENETKLFKKQYDGVRPTYARLYVWSGIQPLAAKKTVVIPADFTDDDIYVLAIGNSFSQDAVSKLSDIAKADGISIIPYNAYKAGRPLKDHYNAWINNKDDYRIEPYGVSNGQYSTAKDLAQLHDWDYIMLQGTTHFNAYDEGLWGADPENTELYWSTLARGLGSTAPNAKRLVHATWAPMNERIEYIDVIGEELANGTPDPRGAYLKALLPHQQVGADIYSTEKRADGENAYIPTAVAIDYLIRYYRFPEYEGERDDENKYDNSETTRGVYRDTTCHLTDNVGRVLAGLVWYEMITGIPATESTYTRDTLSARDMQKIKEAAHYACQNYATYDPEKIVAPTTETVSAVITPSKNGADATVVFVHDDANRATSKYLLEEFEKYNLYGTAGVWGEKIDNISDEAMADWKNIFANGRLGVSSHSYTHNYMGESDEAESGTLKDGTSYSFEAGHMTKNIANERVRLNGLFEGHRVLTFIKPGTSYPEGKEQVSAAAKQMIKDNYIGMRNTGGGIDSIPPSDTYSVKSLMAKVGECELDSWLSNLESVVKRKGMLVYLFHNIDDVETPKGQQTSRADVSVLLEKMGEKVASNQIWSAQFDEAMQYAKEYGANAKAEVVIDYTNENIKVTVTDEISKPDPLLAGGREMYDYPLTVKVEVPFDWEYAELTQDYFGRNEVIETFKENGTRYVYANVVPDQGSAYLTEAIN